jgi:hypothetical protein
MAFDHLLAVGVVVVGQFLPRGDVPSGTNPDVLADNLAITVGLAGVVDEARDTAVHVAVADPAPVDREAPDLAPLQVFRLPPVAFLVIDQLAIVGDDAGVLVDWFFGENAPSMKLGAASNDLRQCDGTRHVVGTG